MKNFKPHINYKNSGSTWLGDIPEHWEVLSFKNILTERNEKNNPIKTKEILSLSIDKGVTLYAEKTTNLDRFKDDFTQYKLAHKNDLVFNSMNMIVGAVGVSKYFGCVSPVYYTYFGGSDDLKTTKFYEYLFRNKIVQSFLFSLGRGLMAIDRGDGKYNTLRLKVSRDDLRSLKLPFPNLIEQTAIANFLDYKTAKVDRFIRKKKQLIKLLNEQKAGIINHAITKGLDATAKMKSSGIEWLGDIPEHWEVRKLKYLGKFQNGISASAEYFGSGFPFVNYGDIYKNFQLPITGSGLAKSSIQDQINYSVEKGDVFFTRTSETIEEIGLTSTCLRTIENATFSGFIIRFRPQQNILFDGYSKYYFRSNLHRRFFVKEMNLVTRASLSQELLKRLPVIIPPFEEQILIYTSIEKETAKLNKAIATIENEITLVKEYKTALIAEAVTGKIDVREFVVPEIVEAENYEDLEEELNMVAEDGEEIEME
jgi:type I restriction enzyme S subunit